MKNIAAQCAYRFSGHVFVPLASECIRNESEHCGDPQNNVEAAEKVLGETHPFRHQVRLSQHIRTEIAQELVSTSGAKTKFSSVFILGISKVLVQVFQRNAVVTIDEVQLLSQCTQLGIASVPLQTLLIMDEWLLKPRNLRPISAHRAGCVAVTLSSRL